MAQADSAPTLRWLLTCTRRGLASRRRAAARTPRPSARACSPLACVAQRRTRARPSAHAPKLHTRRAPEPAPVRRAQQRRCSTRGAQLLKPQLEQHELLRCAPDPTPACITGAHHRMHTTARSTCTRTYVISHSIAATRSPSCGARRCATPSLRPTRLRSPCGRLAQKPAHETCVHSGWTLRTFRRGPQTAPATPAPASAGTSRLAARPPAPAPSGTRRS